MGRVGGGSRSGGGGAFHSSGGRRHFSSRRTGRARYGGSSANGADGSLGALLCVGAVIGIVVLVVIIATTRSSSPTGNVAIPDRAGLFYLSPNEQYSLKVATPFFYDTVSIQLKTYSTIQLSDSVKKLRITTMTRADPQQPELRSVQPTRSETHRLTVNRGDYAYIAFSGMLAGSRFGCSVTEDQLYYLSSGSTLRSLYYFANKDFFNEWSSNYKARATSLLPSWSTKFNLTTTVDSLNEMYFVLENDASSSATFLVKCDITAVQFDTANAKPIDCATFPCSVAIPMSGETSVYFDQLSERSFGTVPSYEYQVEVKTRAWAWALVIGLSLLLCVVATIAVGVYFDRRAMQMASSSSSSSSVEEHGLSMLNQQVTPGGEQQATESPAAATATMMIGPDVPHPPPGEPPPTTATTTAMFETQ